MGTDAGAEIERLTAIIAALQRHRFGARSEQLHPDQLALAFEELDATVARVRAGLDASGDKPNVPRARDGTRGRLPAHLERVEQVVDVENKTCARYSGALHVIGEEVAERIDVAPVQVPAPARVVGLDLAAAAVLRTVG